MKKRVIFLILLTAVMAVLLVGCADEFDKITIDVADVVDAPSGDNTIMFSIPDYDKLQLKYNLSTTVKVYDEDGNSVNVVNNRTVTLAKDHKYTVNIQVKGIVDNEIRAKSAQYTITTQKAQRVIKFFLTDGDITEENGFIPVDYGYTLPFDSIPEVPDFYGKTTADTDIKEITSKKWVIYINDKQVDLSAEHLVNITENMNVYGVYTYSTIARQFTVKFETNGGSTVNDVKGSANDILRCPAMPTKDGCTFFAWYTDEKFTTMYDWAANTKITNDTTLYAKWINNVTNPTKDNMFDYTEKVDTYGNKYYSIKAKDNDILSGELVLPNAHNGYPVRAFEANAFRGAKIISVIIPNSYDLDTTRAFFGCVELETVTFMSGSTLQQLGMNMFNGCTKLLTVALPDSVKLIREKAFKGCASLKTVTLSTDLFSINKNAFEGCISLEEVNLPSATYSVLEEAFKDCTVLLEINIPEDSKLSTIYANAFDGTAVTAIKLPVTFKDKNPFADTAIVATFYEETKEGDK